MLEQRNEIICKENLRGVILSWNKLLLITNFKMLDQTVLQNKKGDVGQADHS